MDNRKLAKKGRFGDTHIRNVYGLKSHVNKVEADLIDEYGFIGEMITKEIGSGTINPSTGLPEFGWQDWLEKGYETFVPDVVKNIKGRGDPGEAFSSLTGGIEWGKDTGINMPGQGFKDIISSQVFQDYAPWLGGAPGIALSEWGTSLAEAGLEGSMGQIGEPYQWEGSEYTIHSYSDESYDPTKIGGGTSNENYLIKKNGTEVSRGHLSLDMAKSALSDAAGIQAKPIDYSDYELMSPTQKEKLLLTNLVALKGLGFVDAKQIEDFKIKISRLPTEFGDKELKDLTLKTYDRATESAELGRERDMYKLQEVASDTSDVSLGASMRKQMQGRKKIGQGYKFASDTFAGALSSAEISKEKGLEAWETGAETEMDKLLNTIMDS